MATQRFDGVRLAAVSPSLLAPPLHMSSYAAPPMQTQGVKAGAIRTEAEWPAEAIVNLRDLGRGVGWALGIEGAAAFIIYAVWYLRHLWL
ncbi:MAG: hypothetical protein ABSG10_07440 [Terracidiphilus sp.]